jgi:hypothetical protein
MGVVAQVAISFVLVECYSCGVPFQVTKQLNDYYLNHRDKSFCCPNGHSQHYIGKTEEQKLREALQWEKERRERAESRAKLEENSKRVYKGHLTRVRRRVSGGVCPCCNRTFVALQRHMKTKHPDYELA